jgi:hypothetical protein
MDEQYEQKNQGNAEMLLISYGFIHLRISIGSLYLKDVHRSNSRWSRECPSRGEKSKTGTGAGTSQGTLVLRVHSLIPFFHLYKCTGKRLRKATRQEQITS